ncbi:DHA2 family efflux MFS transporter permease subunit [Sphingomonas bacterium]|uniref:DHA2 family efflux MFS transporter permease subunit n=1 Tax=Sphingomonas bacterium TaxID=1895847 RepID=UPI0026702BAC|nr:DHA2 family efflux MFS transporter permease subunit [Sphingomonas bacterium]
MSGDSGGRNAWTAVAAGTLGSLMATLDSSIVSASLPTIQGEIGASANEGTWISTAYLVAEIVMIPLAGYFDRLLGLRRFLIVCTIGFVVSSVLCGLSGSLGIMIFGRIGQGFFGGAMIPTALTIVSTMLSPGQRAKGIALFGFTVVVGPVAGPIVGGYLTEIYSWHYIFFINVPISAALLVLLVVGLPKEEAQLGLIAEADWLGIVGLSVSLGALTVILEEGQRERWFESPLVVRLTALSITGLVVLIVGQLTARRPVINLRIILQRAFFGVFVLSLSVGAALYGISYVIPQFLDQLADYNAFQAGEVTFIIGIPSLLLMAAFPIIEKRVDIRIVIGMGLLFYGIGCLMNARLTPSTSGVNFVVSMLVIGLGQYLALVFLNSAATSAVPKELAEDASGLFNAARNLGGSLGLATITILRENRTWLHAARFSEGVTQNSALAQPAGVAPAAGQIGMVDPGTALTQSYTALDTTFRTAGSALAFADVFFVFGILMLASLPLVLLLKPVPKEGSQPG